MDEQDIEALRKASPLIDMALHELEMRDYFQAKMGISDIIKPDLWANLIGDDGIDCD